MISRSTVLGGLIVVELAIVGAAASALTGGGTPSGYGAPTSMGSTALDRTFITGPAPRVVVDVGDVHVTVETAGSPSVHVVETVLAHGFMSGKPDAVVAEQTPDGVRVHSTGDGSLHVMLGHFNHELRLVVPATARLELATGGRIDASGLRAKLVAHSSDGSIHVRDHQADLDASTDSGRVELVDVQGKAIDATTRDGRIYLTRVGADRLVAHSDSGRIVGAGVRAFDGSLTTADGRVIVSFTAGSDATAQVHTDDGEVRVAGFSSTDDGTSKRTVRLGSGRGHFEISTASGPITITQGANV
ncbi:MAG: hypothetical protein JWO85_1826 [Candidatus Eremiobacteraeota bacterium]|nr:hypothetical protein [Candidatus Eremiobacteraeota bacterium]